jgi:hypothetical protein
MMKGTNMTRDNKIEFALFAINWLAGFGMGLTIAQLLK